ncbi:hypothetical protein OHB41_43715 [Streptomyces sp. NBC_01571]|uniref:hypothetical protein n=1 Tax=Streptomyces sp. NBC_01571 TaxID=2975883 RepID=UPI00224F5C8F|nr:hypothetical protein [Streptomyces sp. NBC_01571]MCX4579959.1 hypothetical protein [Streptomyces sp. NBC_01571]
MKEEAFTASLSGLTGRPLSGEMLHDIWLSARSRDGLRVLPALLRYMDERRDHTARWTGALRT